MALDTQNKRRSAAGFEHEMLMIPLLPSGAMDAQSREAVSLVYVGLSYLQVVGPIFTTIERLSYAGDIRMFLLDGGGAIAVDQNDLVRDAGLETAILISIFTDKRADLDEQLPDESNDLRGWFGDTTLEIPGDKTGSFLWLLERAKMENSTYARAEAYVRDSLQWMLDDGVAAEVGAVVSKVNIQTVGIVVTLKKPKGERDVVFRWFYNWENQLLRRA